MAQRNALLKWSRERRSRASGSCVSPCSLLKSRMAHLWCKASSLRLPRGRSSRSWVSNLAGASDCQRQPRKAPLKGQATWSGTERINPVPCGGHEPVNLMRHRRSCGRTPWHIWNGKFFVRFEMTHGRWFIFKDKVGACQVAEFLELRGSKRGGTRAHWLQSL